MAGDDTADRESPGQCQVAVRPTSQTTKLNADEAPSHQNLADESLYRWFPPVGNGAANTAASCLDSTFEAIHVDLSNRWSLSSCCPKDKSTSNHNSNSNKNAIRCLASNRCDDDNYNTTAVGRVAQNGSSNGAIAHGSLSAPASTAATVQNGTITKTKTKAHLEATRSASTSSSQLLFLVRHGETNMNAAGKLQGRGINAHLNEVGLMQAEGLGRFVRNVPFDTITSSSLHRAHETAMRVAECNLKCLEQAQENIDIVTSSSAGDVFSSKNDKTTQADFCCGDRGQIRVRKCVDLDELSWGELEGQDSKQEPWKSSLATLKAAWDEGDYSRAAKGGENLLEVEARARAAIEECLDRGQDLNLIACHGRTLRILMLSLSGLGLDQMTNMGKIPNAGLYIIEAQQASAQAPRTYRLLRSSL